MYRAYTARYLNLDKCELIRQLEACPRCGFELDFSHRAEEREQTLEEQTICPHCQKKGSTRHLLH